MLLLISSEKCSEPGDHAGWQQLSYRFLFVHTGVCISPKVLQKRTPPKCSTLQSAALSDAQHLQQHPCRLQSTTGSIGHHFFCGCAVMVLSVKRFWKLRQKVFFGFWFDTTPPSPPIPQGLTHPRRSLLAGLSPPFSDAMSPSFFQAENCLL